MVFKFLKLDRLSKSTVRTVAIAFGISNGIVFCYTYKTLRDNRPKFVDKGRPPESHRMAIFNNMASTYDSLFDKPLEANKVNKAKRVILKSAKGHVLDVASGTLNNLPFYKNLESLTAIDKSPNMCYEMRKKIGMFAIVLGPREKPDFPVVVILGDVQRIPFRSSSFNTVVSTHTLCSVEDPEAMVSEIERVMKPSGKLLAVERGRIYYAPLRKLMQALKIYPNPGVPWKNGYYEDRDPMALIKTKLEVSKYGISGYGINYSVIARKVNREFTGLTEEPQILPEARVFYTYVPLRD
ncbi:uncharacterized protein TOT_030000440 [Theileria orientalis strain Shintoku]|uniref:Methyltransferase type 11 domain-containing protein n=1 Tax=Theileria orientalis strain Shintoku TaxID=869250 RepID=J4CDI0_THEOR|nr:uncharacterized protein TOT_030000440 [Theileria orientalis strain Shintoku]PVC52772.1 hypothetical protein MACL_00000533 [Theileria orientalis]BAM41177.1 uncharacterized protein TOT_030000440 [Theileria orientalis strain Shintoku]|eukprot:XP_009691478.1 uncharacterized protein TOT_030000440 [Theileria orientalis strain Shintoku]